MSKMHPLRLWTHVKTLRHVKEVGLYAVEVGEKLIFITLYSDHWKWYLYHLEHHPFFELEKIQNTVFL